MADDTLKLDGCILIEQLNTLGLIGVDDVVGGRTRIALTDTEKSGRDQVVAWMKALDLHIEVDRIGNVFGILPAQDGELFENTLMMGSHIDTVTNAGALDGCYGVLAGLAVIRAYRQAGTLPVRPIVVGAFTNEEGVRYQPDMMGSLVYAGGLSLEEALDTIGTDGSRLGDELARIGYAGNRETGFIRPAEYIELHIEQGPVLEAEGKQIGIVENLQGISWQQFTVQGNANHAGTTPTRLRHDAGLAASSIICELRRIATDSNSTTLATVGSIRFEPNVINVIPRKATFTVDLRDPDEELLSQAESRLSRYVAKVAEQEGVTITSERLVRFKPVVFDASLCDEIETAVKRRGLTYRRITSGAGHDAQMIARIAPAAMIFVPSQAGISHNPREHTDEQDLIEGARVLLDVVVARMKFG